MTALSGLSPANTGADVVVGYPTRGPDRLVD